MRDRGGKGASENTSMEQNVKKEKRGKSQTRSGWHPEVKRKGKGTRKIEGRKRPKKEKKRGKKRAKTDD